MKDNVKNSIFDEELRKANESAMASVFETIRLSNVRANDVPSKDNTTQEKAREIIPNILPNSSSLIAPPEPRLNMVMGIKGRTVANEDGMEQTIIWPTGVKFPFYAIWDSVTNDVFVYGGSYHYLNTNTDVQKTEGNGTYVYAVIKRLSRWDVNIKFSIEITHNIKDPTILDSENNFIEFSNVLLAEVITVNGDIKMVQRRFGNFTMINQIVNGLLAVWPLSSGGTI